jgi:hypothetical protein
MLLLLPNGQQVCCYLLQVGHNKGDEFTFQWWDHVFNKAASSISVKSEDVSSA